MAKNEERMNSREMKLRSIEKKMQMESKIMADKFKQKQDIGNRYREIVKKEYNQR